VTNKKKRKEEKKKENPVERGEGKRKDNSRGHADLGTPSVLVTVVALERLPRQKLKNPGKGGRKKSFG